MKKTPGTKWHKTHPTPCKQHFPPFPSNSTKLCSISCILFRFHFIHSMHSVIIPCCFIQKPQTLSNHDTYRTGETRNITLFVVECHCTQELIYSATQLLSVSVCVCVCFRRIFVINTRWRR